MKHIKTERDDPLQVSNQQSQASHHNPNTIQKRHEVICILICTGKWHSLMSIWMWNRIKQEDQAKGIFQKVANKIHHEVLTTQQEKWQTKISWLLIIQDEFWWTHWGEFWQQQWLSIAVGRGSSHLFMYDTQRKSR